MGRTLLWIAIALTVLLLGWVIDLDHLLAGPTPFAELPGLMRRLAERPANVLFMAGSIVKEARGDTRISKPAAALGAGIVAGIAATLFFRRRR